MKRTNNIYDDFRIKVFGSFEKLADIIEKEGVDSYVHVYYKAIEIATNIYNMELWATDTDISDYFERQLYKRIREIAEKVHRNFNIQRHDKMIVYTELLDKMHYYFSKVKNLGGDETARKIYFDMMNEIEKAEEKEETV